MEKRKVSNREFFNKVIAADAVMSSDGNIPTIYGYFAVVNIPADEAKREIFLRSVYGSEADSIEAPESGYYMVVKDTKDGTESVISKGYLDEIEFSFYRRQQSYNAAVERKKKVDSWGF